MNTLMYEHPLTAEHLRIVKEVVHYNIVGPIGKHLACGDVGMLHFWHGRRFADSPTGIGAMTEWKDIVQIVVDQFQLAKLDD